MWLYWLSLLKSRKVMYVVLLTQLYLVWFRACEDFQHMRSPFCSSLWSVPGPCSLLACWVMTVDERRISFKDMNTDTPELHSDMYHCLAFPQCLTIFYWNMPLSVISNCKNSLQDWNPIHVTTEMLFKLQFPEGSSNDIDYLRVWAGQLFEISYVIWNIFFFFFVFQEI